MVTITNNKPITSAPIHSRDVKVQTKPTLERSPKIDVVQTKKKKAMSKGTKWSLGIVGTILSLASAGLACVAYKRYTISQLYKKKLILSNLGENLQFKEASTVEEGIKFAKEILKIKEVDSDISLDAINEVNKGLVKVSNANKGKLFMPTAIRYKEIPNNVMARVSGTIKQKDFGELTVNKLYFDNKKLDEILKGYFDHFDKDFFKNTDCYFRFPILISPKPDFRTLIKKYLKSSSEMTIAEKRKLFYSLSECSNMCDAYKRTPLDMLEQFKTNEQIRSFLEKENINYNELRQKSTKEQSEYITELVKKMGKKRIYYRRHIGITEPEKTIYHEIGHLQDFAENLKKLDLSKYKFSNFKQFFSDIEELTNRWGSITSDKDIKELLDKEPKKFKEIYPDLYEFLTNQETQQTAGQISNYAQSGIGEFIAEVYARMISGKQIPKNVKALYDKFNGPSLP